MRINKFLSFCGVSSRRAADRLIEEGRVKINGKVIRKKGFIIDPETDMVQVDNEGLEVEQKVYIIINKPKGIITAASDPENRKTVIDLLKDVPVRVFPVGRLDYNSQGLLLLTNDGELSYRLLHPSYKVYKTYRVKLYGGFSNVKLNKLRYGVELSDGITSPCEVKLLKAKGKETNIEIRIHEGRKRQIRRMCKEVGYKVTELIRVRMGSIKLGSLRPGCYRELGPNELKKLKKIVGL